MNKKIQNFLEQFDSNFQNQIVEFAKRLTNISKEYDVLIFLARKAACLADCFDDLGLSQYHCVITSDRTLDMNIDWLKGRKIAIIDDALISGTTIYKALEKLKENGIKDTDVFVLSIDSYWWSDELVLPMEPYLKLNSKQTSIICTNIVDAISIIPRPYTIDYPLFKNIRIKESDFQDLSNSADWIVYESTSTKQEEYNIVNLTITPSDRKAIDFFKEIGLDYNVNTLLKLRLYAVKIKDTYWCQILPIYILPAINKDDLILLFEHIFKSTNKSELIMWFDSDSEINSLKSKLRFLQYYLACRLGYRWHMDIVQVIDSNISFQQDFRNLNFLFSPQISNKIEKITYEQDINFTQFQINTSHQVIDDFHKESIGIDEQIAIQRLTKPFLELYYKKELLARSKVKELGIKVFDNKEYKSLINRLNQGYSFIELQSKIKEFSNEFNLNKLVSYFLDIFIDRGAVVPITCFDNGIIYRAFRHGEDVEFSENEMRLSVSMLYNIAQEFGTLELPHTIVEKALVLFIRVGIKVGFLKISTYPMGDYRSIGIRFYLHGAVVGQSDKKIYNINYDETLTKILEEAGYLWRKNFTDPYKLARKPETGMDVKGLSIANQLGLVIGNLLKPDDKKIKLDDLILFSTCTYPKDTVGALAAEMQIFQTFYHYEKHSFFIKYNNNSEEKFSKIRTKRAFTALNSGSWKYENYIDGTIWKIINNINGLFDNPLYSEVWKSFWPSSGSDTSTEKTDSPISTLINRLADWLLSVRFYINHIEVSLSKDFESFVKSRANNEIKIILLIYQKYLPDLFDSYDKIYKRTCERFEQSILKREKLYNFSLTRINEKFHYGRQLLSEVDALSNSFGKVEKVAYYEHALLIDFKAFNLSKEIIDRIYLAVLEKVKVEAKKKDRTYIFAIPKELTSIQTGTWLCTQGKNSRRWLIYFTSKLLEELEGKANLKFTFFFHLGYFRIIKKIMSNQYYAPVFWDIAKELLKKKFKLKPTNEIIYFTQSFANICPIENEFFNEFKQIISTGEKLDLSINNPYNLSFSSNHFIVNSQKIKNIIDIGIITIMPPELKAVTDYFKENNTYVSRNGALSSRKYHFGKIETDNSSTINIVVNQAIEQGSRSAISSYNAISEEFNPQLIVLLGIGGSIHKDANVCDVVIADSTYYYDKRAETDEGTKRRIDPFKLNAWTKSLISEFQHEVGQEEPLFNSAPDSPFSSFKLLIGPIGTGEAVVKFRESDVRKWLMSVNDKTLALETEAGGVTQQFYEDELSYSRRAKGILIIRGISDKADIDKDDKYRLASAKNAVKVLTEFIKTVNIIEN